MVDNSLFLTQLPYILQSFSVVRKFRIVEISFNSPSSNMNLMFHITFIISFYINIYISRLSVCPSKGFTKASATDDFDLLILCPVYILIMNGLSLVPFPVALVVDLREIEGRTPMATNTLMSLKEPELPKTNQTKA